MDLSKFEREDFPIVNSLDLKRVSETHSLRCDAKQAKKRFREYERLISSTDSVTVGECVPTPFVKGKQPSYLDDEIGSSGVPVINTMSIQDMRIFEDELKYISCEDYESLSETL